MKIRRRRGCDDGNLDGNFRFEMRLETQRKKQELSRMTKAVNLRAGSALAHFFPPFAFLDRTIIQVSFKVNGSHLTTNCRTAIRR